VSYQHPDFESFAGVGETTGLVAGQLGPDKKPVFNSTTGDGQNGQQLTGETEFNQWYNTISGTNYAFPDYELVLKHIGNGVFEYDNSDFFPLTTADGFGGEGNAKNYHFTTEIHTVFRYRQEDIFRFRGDDDLWMFVDGKLAMDLGGLHPAEDGEVNLDTLGLIPGTSYTMDIFHAERHTPYSNFKITTTIRPTDAD
jgi:fibro-slime domain-containing protein